MAKPGSCNDFKTPTPDPHIILKGNRNVWTLLPLKYRKHVKAEPGGHGGESHSTGANGKDIILDVPLGTIAKDAETGEVHFEITKDGEEKILLPGGRGGLGNSHFKSATNQTPRYAQPGEPGQEAWKILELKVLADVGLVGFPNAGKSTLLSVMTAAKPEIANYPFTTLQPNLGVVLINEYAEKNEKQCIYKKRSSIINEDISFGIEPLARNKKFFSNFSSLWNMRDRHQQELSQEILLYLFNTRQNERKCFV